MAIRFTKSYNAEIRNVVRNFNQKRNRAIRKGFTDVPPLMSVNELKSRYSTRRELNNELNNLKKFNVKKTDALREIETTGGAKAIKWEYEYLKSNIKFAREYYDREIAKARLLDTPLQILRSDYINTLKAKRDYLNLELAELTQSQYRTFRKTISEYVNATERKESSYRGWLNEVETIMRHLGYSDSDIDEFFEGFDELSPQEFTTMYQQNSLISRIYELYLPTRDDEFRLSTSESDAKEIIDALKTKKEGIINKARKSAKLSEAEIDAEIKKIKRENKPVEKKKLIKSELSKEDLEILEALGYEF